jgi:hypothetical protein
MSNQENQETEGREEAAAATAVASVRIGNGLASAALDAHSVGVDEQSFVEAARSAYKQIGSILKMRMREVLGELEDTSPFPHVDEP